MPGWEHTEYILLIIGLCLLPLSAFFSGSETALFGLGSSQRMSLSRHHAIAAAAVDQLLAEPRGLLITILLGNMLVNVTFFVICSVLMMQSTAGVIGEGAIAVLSLLLIVLFGEVLPKMVANTQRVWFAVMTAAPLLVVHRLSTPLRVALSRFIVSPLSRLTAPPDAPARLSTHDLEALLSLSTREGIINDEEKATLREVLHLSRLKVRDVMTPRVEVHAIPHHARPHTVTEVVRKTRLVRLPVIEGDLDHIIGVLDVRRYLLNPQWRTRSLRRIVEPAQYVPETATLNQLLEHFQKSATAFAVVIDEYGGTSGVVSVDDVVEEIVGDLAPIADDAVPLIEPIDVEDGKVAQWRVRGDMPVHDWAEQYEIGLPEPRYYSTVGGFVFDALGRAPRQGDTVTLPTLHIEVEEVRRARIWSVIVTRRDAREGTPEEDALEGEVSSDGEASA